MGMTRRETTLVGIGKKKKETQFRQIFEISM
jgi:hypothetical protein